MLTSPKDQNKLFIYKKEFNFFTSLYSQEKLPNKILIKGKKGIGKSTFAYHFINYILSLEEEYSYNIKNLTINFNNKSYNLIKNSVHPNLYDINLEEKKKTIEIEKIRDVIKFNNHSGLYDKKKIILIDDAEFLNTNSSNALLKLIEEPNQNTIIILILDSSKKILETLNSRFVSFFFHLTFDETIEITNKVLDVNIHEHINNEYLNLFLTPSFLIQLFSFSKEEKIDLNETKLKEFINIIIDKSLYKKNIFLSNNFNIFLELYLNQLIKINKNKENIYMNYNKLIKNINFANKFNLDKDNIYYDFKNKFINA
tara:strand:- start:370 stop:1308 length:939 start_codon:yes stop_codon:yes gene_type:complete